MNPLIYTSYLTNVSNTESFFSFSVIALHSLVTKLLFNLSHISLVLLVWVCIQFTLSILQIGITMNEFVKTFFSTQRVNLARIFMDFFLFRKGFCAKNDGEISSTILYPKQNCVFISFNCAFSSCPLKPIYTLTLKTENQVGLNKERLFYYEK